MDAFNWIGEFVCGIGIIMGLSWLFNKSWWLGGAQHLALYLLLYSLVFLEQNLYWTQFYVGYPHLLLLTDPLALLLGPLLYFYQRGNGSSANKKVILHFLPALLILLAYMPIYLLDAVDKIELLKNTIWRGKDINATQFVLFRIVLMCQIIGYGYFILVNQKYNWHWKVLLFKKTPVDQLILISFLFLGILRGAWLSFTLVSKYEHIVLFENTIRLLTTIGILYLFIQVISRTKINMGAPYANSLIENDELDMLKQKLMALMQHTEPYMKKNLKMIEIASGLNISEHKLSQLLNVHLGTSFYDYVNQFRISKAKLLLKDLSYEKFTIEAIASECGFSSKSTFNTAFKKIEGVTPSLFKKQLLTYSHA